MKLIDDIYSSATTGTVSVQGNEAKAAALNYKLGVSSGTYPSIGTGTGQNVTVKKIVDTPTTQSVSTQAYTVTTNKNNVANVDVKKTASVGSVISTAILGNSDGTKKDNTSGGFSFFSGNQLPGSNPNFTLNTGNLPLGGNNTVYLPFGGNNNTQPFANTGANPYIIMPGGTGTNNSQGLDTGTLLIIGAIGLGGIFLLGRSGGNKK